ncbi:ATP-grasp domain-containing protein [Mesorhizobium sp. 8]|uniref:ATP-binding protein n=1 Tax=Mesorhizobium sp. 8 TaxID=2584466 RepID=UPI0011203410|nr:ATP-grasp domain-containing protein [Mesorhizobium sp. 8]QDC01876.1 ATP-grasp domain-containing protein [Mesorhizobium sp. 8]
MKPRVLFLSLLNNVGLGRIICAMASSGCECGILSPPGFYYAQTRFAERRFQLPRHLGVWRGVLAVQYALETLLWQWPPDVVFPLDDVASWLLRGMVLGGLTSMRLTQVIERSLGPSKGYSACLSRFELMSLASGLGVRTPHTVQARTRAAFFDAVESWGYPVVVKSEFTCGGAGVTVAADRGELEDCAARYFPASPARLRSLRSGVRKMIWRRAGIPQPRGNALVLQSHIAGGPAMTMVAAREGHVLESVSFVAERVNPAVTGVSTVVSHIEHEEMRQTARRIVAALGCSGFISFDFMLSPRTQEAFLIEMNARAIGTGHLGAMFGHDVCGALAADLGGWPRPMPRPLWDQEKSIALFPRDLEREPDNLARYKAGNIHLDLPADDPALVEAYLGYLAKQVPGGVDGIRTALALPPGQPKWRSAVAAGLKRLAGPGPLAGESPDVALGASRPKKAEDRG